MGTSNSSSIDPENIKVHQNLKKIKHLTDVLTLRSEHQKQILKRGWDKHEENLQNAQILKGMFKKLDPTVMQVPGEDRGEIELSFKYDYAKEILMIKVIKCRDLRNRDLRSKMFETFVRLQVMPDHRSQGPRMTKIIRTNSPRYDEIFTYKIDGGDLGEAKLIAQVVDHSLGGLDEILGETIIDLKNFDFRNNPVHTAWYCLNAETDLSIKGELQISMAFQAPNTLLVTVHGANNLSPRDEDGLADPFVKISIPGTHTLHQTKVCEKTLDPTWIETFEFEMYEEEFENRNVVFHVIDKDTSTCNDSLGQVVISLKEFNRETGLSGSFPLSDLKNMKQLRSQMHTNKVAEEFKEALLAHSFARVPHAIFKSHSGEKYKDQYCRKINI
ncbi:hypothetical protein ACJMK2_016656 [Sinanodonta woodiana]|uniref:C2 domain-containing protein n=1 Tax=Sinanodonta woodiana TaxID=1069815 RepID=A0ABD3UV48_SINWO